MEPVSSVANAVSSVADLLTPLVREGLRQKYNHELNQSITKWSSLLSSPDSDSRRDDIHSYLLQLFADSGTSPGLLSGNNIELPVEVFNSLVIIANQYNQMRKVLAAVQYEHGK